VARKAVLDYGSAVGQHTERFLPCSLQAGYGIDLGERAIERAQAKNLPRATLVVGGAHRLPWPDRHFEVIVGRR
jgi:ubiquinone/menaquinone biosynthesis C-methylase UbiE